MILIDFDVLIDVIRKFPPAVTWLQSVSADIVATPGYVIMELIDGCRDKAEQQQLDQTTASMPVVWPSSAACDAAVRTFRALHLSHNLGLLDSLIAQTAVELRAPLHTFNVKHFQHVPGLTTIRPYTK